MNQRILIILISFFVWFGKCLFASTIVQGKTSQLSFSADAPPAIFYVVDDQGRRSGADPMAATNVYGQQINNRYGLKEIPNSYTEQDNEAVGNFDTGDVQPNSTTMWSVNIYDGQSQFYNLNVQGIKTGIEEIGVTGVNLLSGLSNIAKIDVFVSSGVTRQFKIIFNSNQTSPVIQPTINLGDLKTDVNAACQLGMITSNHVCGHLLKKSEDIQEALQSQKTEKAENLLKSFLSNLGENHGDGDDDQDDHKAIKAEALNLLVADAKTLLKQLEAGERHDHQ